MVKGNSAADVWKAISTTYDGFAGRHLAVNEEVYKSEAATNQRNQAIGMLKGTSLASTITLMELTGVANTIVASTFSPYEIFIMAALIYLAITLVITRCFKYVEYALSKHQRPLKNTAAISGQVRHAD